MAVKLSQVDPDVFSGIKSGNVQSLEHLFRASYHPLLADATSRLNGDGAAAARAVEAAFVQAWKARSTIASADALEAGLENAVQDEAARIVSRHSIAHHLDDLEGGHLSKAPTTVAPSVDQAWGKVKDAIDANRHEAAAKNDAAAHSRHEAAEQLGEIAREPSKVPVIAMATILVIAVIGIVVWTRRTSDVTALAQGLAAADARVTVTAAGEHPELTLTDGTQTTLGPDSKLRVPAQFGRSMRGLELTGTAHFVVASGTKQRFMVRTGPALLTATGTEFTVRAYPAEHRVTVLVRDGNITVTAGDSTHSLGRGDALVIADDHSMRAPTAAELDEVGWGSGIVVVDNRPLREVLPELKRWFGYDFFAADTSLLGRPVTLRARVDSLSEAIASVEQSGGLQMVKTGQNMAFKEARR